MDAYIPPQYILNEMQKLDIYKRIAGIENADEKEEMLEELIDRFGEPPKSVENLLNLAEYKAKAHRYYFTEVAQRGDLVKFVLYEKAKIDPAKIPGFVALYQGKLKFYADKRLPYFAYHLKLNSRQKESAMDVIADVLDHAEMLI